MVNNYKTISYGLIGVGLSTMFLVDPVAGAILFVASGLFALADSKGE